LGLAHPDLHWFIPVARPKAGEADKQVEEAAELIGEAVAARREEPMYVAPDGTSAHFLACARLLLREGSRRPAMGKRKVFVVGEADRLVPQESSPESANALLKFLEEPPPDTWVLLTTTEPERVLPTIRSRAVPLRLGRLTDAQVRSFAETRLPDPPTGGDLEAAVIHAEGSIGRLIAGREAAGKAREEARALLAAVGGSRQGRYERSLKQAPWSARGGFTDLLDALAEELMGRAREAASQQNAEPFVRALTRVEAARADAQRNVNPQLLLATLTGELAEVL
jgi:DNA polymerase-3 subunit delta'